MEKKTVRLTLISPENSAEVVALSADMLNRMRWHPGLSLYAVESTEGILLTPYGPRTREHLAIGREFLHDYEAALQALS